MQLIENKKTLGRRLTDLELSGSSPEPTGSPGELAESSSESSKDMRERAAREIQHARGYSNSRMPTRMIRKQCALDETGERTLEMAMRRMSLSARPHDRILKVARTVADLDGSGSIVAKHIAEAIQYRSLDRNYWN